MAESIQVARLLRGGTTGFVAGCRINQIEAPSFGALVRSPLGETYEAYGLIYDIQIEDDGLVRQLVSSDHISDEVIRDNRERRIVPVELSVLTVGYEEGGRIFHMLPPRPPLSLDLVFLCTGDELVRFTSAGRLGYLRHILRSETAPIGELLSAHIQQASSAHNDGGRWAKSAIQEIIAHLRDDYPSLMSVMGALNEVVEASLDRRTPQSSRGARAAREP